MTDPRDQPAPPADDRFERTWQPPPGLLGRLAVVNNKQLGQRYMVTAFAFFLLGGVLALLMRLQLAVPANDFLGPELFNQLFTMHGSTMMYLFVVPFIEGLAVYLLPVLIGSRDLAFPRLSAFSYWVYLFGGLIFYASFLLAAAPDAGWFAYAPLSGARFSGLGMDFWLMGLSLVELSGIAAGVEIVVTVLKLRAPGMSLGRMPLFAWAFLVTGLMILFAFTTLLTASVMLEFDRALGTGFFMPDRGGSPLLWQHLFWFFGHPEVYIAFIPATGVVSMIVPVAARRPIAAYTLIVVAIIVTGFVSYGLWVHHMYTTGIPTLSMSFFAAASLMIALASGTQIFAWIATIWGGRPAFTPALLYVLGFVFVFVLGGMTGVMVAIVPFDWQVHDTYFVVAHFHYVLIGGVVFPIFGAIYHWAPKLTGRLLSPLLGKLSFWLVFVGFNVTFFPMHIMGFLGMPRRVYTYPHELALGGYNALATAGSFVLSAGILVLIVDFLWNGRAGRKAGDDPWGGDSLEWATSSPPPNYAFRLPPRVRGLHHLWTRSDEPEPEPSRRARLAMDGRPETWRATLVTDAVGAEPQAIHRLAGPTYTPFIAAAALLVAAIAVLMQFYILCGLAVLVALALIASWLVPSPRTVHALRTSTLVQESGLPIFSLGARSPAWWGLLCFLACATTVFGVFIYSYFYLRLYSPVWPQGELPLPDLPAPTAAFSLLAAGALPQLLAWHRFERASRPLLILAPSAAVLLAALFIGVHVYHTTHAPFTPRTNAYGSAFWALCAAAWLQALIAAGFSLAALAGLLRDGRAAYTPLQFQMAAHAWIFAAVAGAAVYATLYLSPILLGDGAAP